MFETISSWFEDMDVEWDKLGWALLIWAFCLLVVWKLQYDDAIMSFTNKIIISIVMLPACYFIMKFMAR